jgi:transposase-like protein
LNSVIYSGLEKDVKVYLYKNGNHFDTINSMTGFYGQSYYCEKCDKPYQNKDGHKCKTKDKICVMLLYVYLIPIQVYKLSDFRHFPLTQ